MTFETGEIKPTSNHLVLAAVETDGTKATISGAGLTWTQVKTEKLPRRRWWQFWVKQTKRITVFKALEANAET